MSARGRTRLLLCAIGVAGVIVAAAAGAGPAWRDAPGIGADQRAVWAVGRLWFFGNGTAGGTFATRSAPVDNLNSMVKDGIAGSGGWTFVAQLGDGLVLSDGISTLWTLTLHRDGTLGEPAPLTGGAPAASSTGTDFARLRDRVVHVANANPRQGLRDPIWIGACCDVQGGTADYHSFVKPGWLPRPWLGVDRRGRLWLAWAGTVTRYMQAGLVELDPATLEPVGQPALMPGLEFAQVVDVVCGNTCRVVARALPRSGGRRSFGTFSWAYGEASATRIPLPGVSPSAFAARDDGGRLVVAYGQSIGGGDGRTIGVARGDARGGKAKPLAKVDAPAYVGSVASGSLLRLTNGVFGSGGLAVVAVYEGRRSVRTRVAILRF